MNTSRILMTLVIVVMLVSACVPGPSLEEQVQTGIAQTKMAELDNQQGDPAVQLPESQAAIDEETPTPTEAKLHAGVPVIIWVEQCYTALDDGKTVFCQMIPEGLSTSDPYKFGPVKALDIKTGEAIWSSDQSGLIMGIDSRNVYVALSQQRLQAFDKTSGAPVWEARFDAPMDLMLTRNNKQLFIDEKNQQVLLGLSGQVIAIDRATGRQVEGIDLGDRSYRFNRLDQVGSTLVFAGRDTIGISMDTRATLWDLEEIGVSGLCGDTVILNNLQSTIAIEASTGLKIWEQKILDGQTTCPVSVNTSVPIEPLVTDSQDILFFYLRGYGKTQVQAVRESDGAILWEDMGEFEFIGETGGLVLQASKGLGLSSAFQAADHKLVWENKDLVFGKLIGRVKDAIIIHQVSGNKLIGIDLQNGKQKWEIALKNPLMGVYIVQDKLFFTLASEPYQLSAVDPDTGKILYGLTIPNILITELVAVDEIVFCRNSLTPFAFSP